MSYKNDQQACKEIKKKNKDVLDRFLSILWKKEVDFKYSTK